MTFQNALRFPTFTHFLNIKMSTYFDESQRDNFVIFMFIQKKVFLAIIIQTVCVVSHRIYSKKILNNSKCKAYIHFAVFDVISFTPSA